MAKILLYNLESEKGDIIRELCKMESLDFRDVRGSEHSKRIKEIINDVVSDSEAAEKMFADEMMVFVDVEDKRLYDFLKSMRERKIAPVELKAMVTEYNMNWTSKELRDELIKENKAMKEYMKKKKK